MGKCSKLALRFCETSTVLKHIGSLAYRLTPPDGIGIHPVFHVSHLKDLLGSYDNIITIEALIASEDYLLNHIYQRKLSMWKETI